MGSIWRTPRRSLHGSLHRLLGRGTLRDIGLVCLADGVVGLSFGAVAVAGGLPAWVPIALSLLVFAGGSQIAMVGIVLAGGGAFAAALSGLVLNTRLMPYGLAVADVLGGNRWLRLLGAHLVTDESTAFALRHSERPRRRAVFWACGLALFASWNGAVALGALLVGSLGNGDALGLDTAFPAVLLALVLPALSGDRALSTAAVTGAALAVATTPLLPAGVPLLLALAAVALLVRRAPTGGTHPDNPSGPASGPADAVSPDPASDLLLVTAETDR
ncbi:MAG TPA: AzlC family ABC transporter permease [Actinocrinis sp.]|jgi:predicted branched-subunit amino acid permease